MSDVVLYLIVVGMITHLIAFVAGIQVGKKQMFDFWAKTIDRINKRMAENG